MTIIVLGFMRSRVLIRYDTRLHVHDLFNQTISMLKFQADDDHYIRLHAKSCSFKM